MGNFRLSRSHRGLGVVLGMHILPNISLVSCGYTLTVLAFLLGLAGKHFFKPCPRLRPLKTCLGNLRLLIGTSLGVFCLKLLQKSQKIVRTTTSPQRFKANIVYIYIQSIKKIVSMLEIQPLLPKTIS